MSKYIKISLVAVVIVIAFLTVKNTLSGDEDVAVNQSVVKAPLVSASVEIQTKTIWDSKLPGRGIGNPDAPLKMIEFSSLGCSHCAAFHAGTLKELKAKYIDTGALYLEFVEFPLNRPALDASKALRCADTAQYYNFMNLLFQTQQSWAFTNEFQSVLKQKAALAGLSNEAFDACMANQDLENKIGANVQAASTSFDIRSTPTFVINGGERVISGNLGIAAFDKAFSQIVPTE